MAEHRDDAVPFVITEVELHKVGDASINRHAAVGGEAPCLHHAHRAQIDGDNMVTVLGEKHAVATFAIAEAQRATLW